jgi:hypothetical protein
MFTRISLMATGVESDIQFQTLVVEGKPSIRRYSPAPPAFNVCACSVAFDCPDPMLTEGPFLCHYGDNCTKGTVAWAVPGISTGCTHYERLLSSDLRCFFDRMCIETILSLYSVDMPNRLPLPAAAFQFTPLNGSLHSKFTPTTKIGTLFQELMLEEWTILPRYEGHYRTCAPAACTYTVTQRSEILYIISTIISFFGGLLITLGLLVPLAVRFAYWSLLRWCHRHSTPNQEPTASPKGTVFLP